MRFKSLKTRILFWFGSITFLLLIIFSVAFNYFFEKSVYAGIEAKLYQEAIYIRENLTTNNIKDFIENNKNISSEVAILENGKVLEKSKNFDEKLIGHDSKDNNSLIIIDDGEKLQGVYLLEDSNKIKIILSQKGIDDKVEDVVDTMLIVEPLLLFALIILGSKVIDKILIPIKNITKVSEEISVDNFSKTIPDTIYEDEIKKLINAFNAMILRLQSGVENLDRFNNDVSHELRTPLTVIRGEIDITLRKERDCEYYIRTLKTLNYEAKQIENIVENLLLLTKYSKDNIKKTFEECSIDMIILDTLLMYKTQLENKNITVNIEELENLTIKANSQLIRTIFSNLIDNAIKYSNDNKNIFITLKKEIDNKTHLIIKDEGIGISKEHLLNITNRFYRVDNSRNKKVKGFGLGLSIVKNSLELHNAELKINSVFGKGTTIEIIF